MGSVPETTTFSSQSATISVASLLSYVVFFDLNRFLLSLYVFPIACFIFLCICSSVYFTFSTIAVSLLLSPDLHDVCYVLFNKYSNTRNSVEICYSNDSGEVQLATVERATFNCVRELGCICRALSHCGPHRSSKFGLRTPRPKAHRLQPFALPVEPEHVLLRLRTQTT